MLVTNTEAVDARHITHRSTFLRLVLLPVMTVLLAGTGVACSDAVAEDPTPVVQFKITPAPATYTTAVVTIPTVLAAASPAAPGVPIQLVARDTTFGQTALTAASGAITISFSNKDSG